MESSKLLINEPALQVLPSLAIRVGLDEAIVLQQIHYWLRIHEQAKSKRHFKDERYWVYNTCEEWQEQFKWWSLPTIKRILQNLEQMQVVLARRYEEQEGNQRKWYSIDYKVLNEIEQMPDDLWKHKKEERIKMIQSRVGIREEIKLIRSDGIKLIQSEEIDLIPCSRSNRSDDLYTKTTNTKTTSENTLSLESTHAQKKEREFKLKPNASESESNESSVKTNHSTRVICNNQEAVPSTQKSERIVKDFSRASELLEVWEDKPGVPHADFWEWRKSYYERQGGKWEESAQSFSYSEFYKNRQRTTLALWAEFQASNARENARRELDEHQTTEQDLSSSEEKLEVPNFLVISRRKHDQWCEEFAALGEEAFKQKYPWFDEWLHHLERSNDRLLLQRIKKQDV